jgi:8-amino-7-oxononanoate synthase
MDLNFHLEQKLRDWDAAHLRRRLRSVETAQGPALRVDGREFLNFSSNDYLGLAAHPALCEAAAEALHRYGAGAGASRLICGNFDLQDRLDQALAAFKRTPAALSFTSGYAAALGTLPALVGKGDVVILDKLAHASLIDAARLSGATLRIFPHNNLDYLENLLKKNTGKKTVIVTESVFSMDGDLAPLRELVEIKNRHGAWLFVDEAHATGVFGDRGAGRIDALNLTGQVDIQMGTLGKALGSCGGFIAGSRTLIDFLLNQARSFVFSTASAPAACAASIAALNLVSSPEGTQLKQRLWHNLSAFRNPKSEIPLSPIIPWMLGSEEKALQTAHLLDQAGFLVPAIRYPTVARNKARLRITVSAAHNPAQISRLADALHSLPS